MERGWNNLWCVDSDFSVRFGGEMVKNGGRGDGRGRRPLVREPKHSAQLKLVLEGKSAYIECRGGLMWCEICGTARRRRSC